MHGHFESQELVVGLWSEMSSCDDWYVKSRTKDCPGANLNGVAPSLHIVIRIECSPSENSEPVILTRCRSRYGITSTQAVVPDGTITLVLRSITLVWFTGIVPRPGDLSTTPFLFHRGEVEFKVS